MITAAAHQQSDLGLAELQAGDSSAAEIDTLFPPRQLTIDRIEAARSFLDPTTRSVIRRGLEQIGTSPDVPARAASWIENGWEESLRYYAWSRCVTYADGADPTGEKRRRTVAQYRETSEPPDVPALPSEHAYRLPSPIEPAAAEIVEGLLTRRSIRHFKGTISTEHLSTILTGGWRSAGFAAGPEVASSLDYFRGAPGVYSVALWIWGIDDVEPGVYLWTRGSSGGDHLTRIRRGASGTEVSEILQGLQAPRSASATAFLLGDLERYSWIYRHEHALRSMYIASGRWAQGATMAAAALRLGSVVTPATTDSVVLDELHLGRQRFAPLHTITFGRPSSSVGRA
ncbi:hypothetical protein GUY44_04295 [Pimelobacter simplex]|uniref:Uncharacterized protein n=1 Tax=Nocardioides simplex TaxID=2045 RepID=A0A0J9YH66_NOCSI|nr:hypothetical protein [Pimelobacter simplex]AIY19493.1 hypothetical protein KR76_26915 [Pimelobacter simplex]MCG8149688.1 hypothetical protein [Pimelobacter simplex]GEB15950.1 hypothetical protein NSI01_42650 [Pimelobacter simplex]SFM82984.1 hypothetical protein SAMN05421671_3565 [Pimelobacter simplex]